MYIYVCMYTHTHVWISVHMVHFQLGEVFGGSLSHPAGRPSRSWGMVSETRGDLLILYIYIYIYIILIDHI